MKLHGNILLAASCAALMALTVPLARGASVQTINLDTEQTIDGSGWQVQRQLAGGETNTTAYVGAVQAVASPPSAWEKPANLVGNGADGKAVWVAWTSAAGNNYTGDVDGYHGDTPFSTTYTYTDTFTLLMGPNNIGPAQFALNGYLCFDNWVSGVTLTGKDSNGNPVAVPGIAWTPQEVGGENGYSYIITTAETPYIFTSPVTFTLTITGANSYGVGSSGLHNGTNPGPTGMIFSGMATAVAVPVPASAGIGFSMLGGFALLFAFRKRISRGPQIA